MDVERLGVKRGPVAVCLIDNPGVAHKFNGGTRFKGMRPQSDREKVSRKTRCTLYLEHNSCHPLYDGHVGGRELPSGSVPECSWSTTRDIWGLYFQSESHQRNFGECGPRYSCTVFFYGVKDS